MKDSEQHSFWKQVQITNRILIKIPGSKTTFEYELNLFEVETYLNFFDKFSKILACPSLLECEFILA
jgi:hypothetical protein